MAHEFGGAAAATLSAVLSFSGRLIKKGERNGEIVKAVQGRLNELGCGPIDVDGDFGTQTERAVRLFQVKFTDTDGLPLKVDGIIGAITWVALFGKQTVDTTLQPDASMPLLKKVLQIADTQVGVEEKPRGSNRGPQVDEYIKSVGLDPAGRFAWCVAFQYWCFQKASHDLGIRNPMIRTAGVLDHWNKAGTAGIARITAARARNNPALVKPGQLFCINRGSGLGHTGLVEQVLGGKLVTIEGNTNEGGSGEGIGVFRRSMRKVADIDIGFIDYHQ
ncbi:MAG: peptidoglycan-binding protein [Bacteroidota bacterium]